MKEIILQTADEVRLIPYGFWSFVPDNPATCHGEQHLLGLVWTYLLTDLFHNMMSVCPAACCQADCVSRILLLFHLQIWLKLVSYLLQGDGERTGVIKTTIFFLWRWPLLSPPQKYKIKKCVISWYLPKNLI